MEPRDPRSENEAHRSPEDLAAEYLAERAEDASTSDMRFLAQLATESEREEFRAIVHDAQRAERTLPRVLSKETLIAGRYRILSEIGSGGMGRVFAAQDMQLGRKVAVKVLSALGAGHAEREELFLKESRLLAAMQHPNIVAVHEAGRDNDLAFIVMDLVDGVSLSDVIDRVRKEVETHSSGMTLAPRDGLLLERAIGKPLEEGRQSLIVAGQWPASVVHVMLELARTLEAAHGRGVIHRDLKPSNVMLLGGAQPIVLDFGLAGSQEHRSGAVTEGLYGSVAYLAPEQAKSQQVGMDPRTDVYQLGLILYELLTLRRAFPGAGIGDVLERIKHGEFKTPRNLNPSVPKDLEAICMMALEVEPENRYASARALREDLERYVEGREAPIAAHASTWRSLARKTRYSTRRHPAYVGLAAMLIVGIGATIVGRGLVARMPAVMTGFRIPRGGSEVIPIRDGQRVERGDSLGMTVNSVDSQFLYVLSIFQRADHQRYFAPMQPLTLEEALESIRTREKPEQKKEWGIRVPGCVDGDSCANLVCTQIDADSEENKEEGLLVFASREQRPDLEDWLGRLSLRPDGVVEAKAMELFKTPDTTRGGQIRSLPVEELIRNYGQLKTAVDAKDEEFELPNLRRWKIECPVGIAK